MPPITRWKRHATQALRSDRPTRRTLVNPETPLPVASRSPRFRATVSRAPPVMLGASPPLFFCVLAQGKAAALRSRTAASPLSVCPTASRQPFRGCAAASAFPATGAGVQPALLKDTAFSSATVSLGSCQKLVLRGEHGVAGVEGLSDSERGSAWWPLALSGAGVSRPGGPRRSCFPSLARWWGLRE